VQLRFGGQPSMPVAPCGLHKTQVEATGAGTTISACPPTTRTATVLRTSLASLPSALASAIDV
jgi:hypothetical protein